ncbi:MAG: PASTA domain-containing protein, partial [Flammeovirgaceae bacterium]|nr:PASTA domain-containing protein [Flammeovirgaceae bacterium]MDW8288636.1 PASTA domain-containing protein [Flammeovirgaceae bacterium]
KGFYVPRGSEILLWVSNGITSDNHYVDVPDLYGVQLDEAAWILTGVGLVIGKVTATDSEHPLGTIVEQKPEVEETEKNGKQRIGSVINVVISNGRKPLTDSATNK